MSDVRLRYFKFFKKIIWKKLIVGVGIAKVICSIVLHWNSAIETVEIYIACNFKNIVLISLLSISIRTITVEQQYLQLDIQINVQLNHGFFFNLLTQI